MEDFARTQASRFRASTDISVTNSLYHYYALMTGRAVQHESAKVLYVDTTLRSGLAKLPKLLQEAQVRLLLPQRRQLPRGEPDRSEQMSSASSWRSTSRCPRRGSEQPGDE